MNRSERLSQEQERACLEHTSFYRGYYGFPYDDDLDHETWIEGVTKRIEDDGRKNDAIEKMERL